MKIKLTRYIDTVIFATDVDRDLFDNYLTYANGEGATPENMAYFIEFYLEEVVEGYSEYCTGSEWGECYSINVSWSTMIIEFLRTW